MTDGKPTAHQIHEASQNGHTVQYEIITYRGVEILMRKKVLMNAIETTYEFTHDPDVEELAQACGIKLRKFR